MSYSRDRAGLELMDAYSTGCGLVLLLLQLLSSLLLLLLLVFVISPGLMRQEDGHGNYTTQVTQKSTDLNRK